MVVREGARGGGTGREDLEEEEEEAEKDRIQETMEGTATVAMLLVDSALDLALADCIVRIIL